MSESASKESDIPLLSLIGSSTERHSSVVGSACDACQKSPRLIPSKAGFLTAALPEFSSQGTSIDLQSAFTLFLSITDKIDSNKVTVTKVYNLLYERTTAQEQDKVSLHPDSSEYQGVDLTSYTRIRR